MGKAVEKKITRKAFDRAHGFLREVEQGLTLGQIEIQFPEPGEQGLTWKRMPPGFNVIDVLELILLHERNYRRAVPHVTVNGIECPAPASSTYQPSVGQTYYIPDIGRCIPELMFKAIKWTGSVEDQEALRRGICFFEEQGGSRSAALTAWAYFGKTSPSEFGTPLRKDSFQEGQEAIFVNCTWENDNERSESQPGS